MAVTNKLKQQVDMPVWEWCRFAPATSAVTTCSCMPDNQSFNPNSGRFIYYNISSGNFWRYDTVADSWMQLASPVQAVATGASMRFAGALGYFGRVISATSTTITTGLPFGGSAVGFKIRIISGTGAGQERVITSVADPVVADFGSASSGQALGTTAYLADTNKTWGSYNGSNVWCVNNWVGYNLRMVMGTGVFQSRKILYNSATTVYIGDTGLNSSDPWADVQCVAPAAGTQYQIESSVITVDTGWSTTPDYTSRYVIQSGGIFLLSSAAATPWYTLQYYDVLADVWYTKPAMTNMASAVGTDFVLERVTENSSIWFIDTATGGTTGSGTTTLVDASVTTWTSNQWANYYVFVYSGSGLGQWSKITSNTTTTLTLSVNWSVATDATSRYQIMGYDLGISTSSAYNTLADSTKTWTTNQWANYAVRILYGTGMGQVRAIVSNTSNTLTLYQNWNIQPDNTSVYVLQGDSDNMYFMFGGSSEVFLHRGGDIDMLSHGRVLASGITSLMTCYLSNASHTIFEQAPISINTITNSTTLATVTTVFSHNLKVGQYVSIRGATGADGAYYNGLFPIVSVGATNTFTYTMSGTPSGSAAGITGPLSSTLLIDAGKQHQQASTGSSSATTISAVSGNFPSHINGWYAAGTGIATGCQVLSGAGTGTLTLSTANSGAVSGQIVFNAWLPSFTIASSSGAQYANTVVLASASPTNCNGWFVSGTGIAANNTSPTYIVSGQGTNTITLSNPNTGAVSGNVTFGNNFAGAMLYATTAVPTAATGLAAGGASHISANTGASLTAIVALPASTVTGVSRYVIAKRDMIGATLGGGGLQHPTYNSGLATTLGSTTTLIDTTARWVSQTGVTGAQYGTTLTLPTPSPSYINGWYVSNGTGTGVQTGARVTAGAGTTSITLSVALTAAASGTYNFDAWSASELYNKRIKIVGGTGAGAAITEGIITTYAPASQTITFGAITTAPAANATSYAIMSTPARAASFCFVWASNFVGSTTRGHYFYSFRGGVVGADRLDITTDTWTPLQYSPIAEALATSSQYTYDGGTRLYFSVGFTQRIYYLDLNTNLVYGSGMYPYAAGSTMIGNRMEIYTTPDGLKYLWINRHANVECFRQLLFY